MYDYILAEITDEIIEAIRPHAPIIEIGAGDGKWAKAIAAAGITVSAFDPVPKGPNVMYGDHSELEVHPDWTPLIVWPPDRTDIKMWLGYRTFALMQARFTRLNMPKVRLDNMIHQDGDHCFKGPSTFAEVTLL